MDPVRHTLSFYEALTVLLDVRRVTSDARLSRAPRLPCVIELI